jgi:hypothetical protein
MARYDVNFIPQHYYCLLIFVTAIANTVLGVVIFFPILGSILHYSGAWYSQFLPMSDSQTYDNTGATYDVSKVVTPQLTLDEAAYKSYSPLFLSTTFAMSYG